MVWETDNKARQRWCTRLWQGGGLSSPLFDGFDNLYVGQPGAMLSFPPTQWIRWRQPVIGMPMTPRILAPGQLLVVTHLGQVLVFDAHRGTVIGTSLDLVEGVDPDRLAARAAPTASRRGRAARSPRRRRSRRRPASWWSALWEPGRAGAGRWSGCATGRARPRCWPGSGPATRSGGDRSPARCCPPTASTVYVNGRDEQLWALNTADGKPKWSVPLDYPAADPAVGVAGRPDRGRRRSRSAKLVAVKDGGDHGDVLWTRDDVVAAVDVQPGGRATSATPSRGTARTVRRCWCSTPPTATPSTATRCREATGLPGRGVDRPRPPRRHRDQRRPGVRVRAGLRRSGDHRGDRRRRGTDTCKRARRPPANSSPWLKKKISASSVIAKFSYFARVQPDARAGCRHRLPSCFSSSARTTGDHRQAAWCPAGTRCRMVIGLRLRLIPVERLVEGLRVRAADVLVDLEHHAPRAARRDGRAVPVAVVSELVRHVARAGHLRDVDEAVAGLLDLVDQRGLVGVVDRVS